MTRVFTGGNVLQRASLNFINGVVYSGFGAHCDLFNYTGWVVGMSTQGNLLTAYTTTGGPGSQPQDGTWDGGGGGGGVWYVSFSSCCFFSFIESPKWATVFSTF